MRSPSRKRLVEAFGIAPKQAGLIKRLCQSRPSSERLAALIERECPETHRYAMSCYGNPFDSRMWRTTMVLHAINGIVGTHGVEALRHPRSSNFEGAPDWEYLNAGDPYATTLLYTRATDTLRIGCWGDIAERLPRGRE